MQVELTTDELATLAHALGVMQSECEGLPEYEGEDWDELGKLQVRLLKAAGLE